MILQFTPHQSETSALRVLLEGTRATGEGLEVTRQGDGKTFLPSYPDEGHFRVVVDLLPGENVIQAKELGEGSLASIQTMITLIELPWNEVNLGNGLDDHGDLLRVERENCESNSVYRDWIKKAVGTYLRDSSLSGLVNTALVRSRKDQKKALRLRSRLPFSVEVRSGEVRVFSSQFVETERLFPDGSGYAKTAYPVRSVIALSVDEWTYDPVDSRFHFPPSVAFAEITYEAIRTCRKDQTLAACCSALSIPCKNSSLSDATGAVVCSQGFTTSSSFPNQLIESPCRLFCGNGSCGFYSGTDFWASLYEESLGEVSTLGLVSTQAEAERNGPYWEVVLSWAPVALLSLAEEEVLRILEDGQQYPTSGSRLESLRQNVNQVQPHIWGTATVEKGIFADDEGLDRSPTMDPKTDLPLSKKDEFQSGSRSLEPYLDYEDGAMRLRIKPGWVWFGPEAYYWFGDKITTPLANLAEGRLDLKKSLSYNFAGTSQRTVPGDLDGDDEAEGIGDWSVTSITINGKEFSPDAARINASVLKLDLGRLVLEQRDLLTTLESTDFLQLGIQQEETSLSLSYQFRQIELTFRIPEYLSGTPVFLTDNRYGTDLDYAGYDPGEFRLERISE